MYVCICNAIRDCELRKAARTCRGDADAVYAAIGRAPQCRQCIDDAEEIIAEERLSSHLPVPVRNEPTLHPLHA